MQRWAPGLLLLVALLTMAPSAAPFHRYPDVMALLKAGRLKFKHKGSTEHISDSTDIVALFGHNFQHYITTKHGLLLGGGSMWITRTHLLYKRQGVEFELVGRHASMVFITLTKPYRHAIKDGVYLGRTTYRELAQRYPEGSGPVQAQSSGEDRRFHDDVAVFEPECDIFLTCERQLSRQEADSINNKSYLNKLIPDAPLTEVWLRQPR